MRFAAYFVGGVSGILAIAGSSDFFELPKFVCGCAAVSVFCAFVLLYGVGREG